MRFLMLVTTDPGAEPYEADQDNIEEWFEDVSARGSYVDGDRLRPTEEAKAVRVREGRLQVADLPVTTESIIGYDVLECADLEEAIGIASRHPMARFGRIELRQAWPLD